MRKKRDAERIWARHKGIPYLFLCAAEADPDGPEHAELERRGLLPLPSAHSP
jgi:hypothetical protein